MHVTGGPHKRNTERLQALEQQGILRFLYTARELKQSRGRDYHLAIMGQPKVIVPGKHLHAFLDGVEAGIRYANFDKRRQKDNRVERPNLRRT